MVDDTQQSLRLIVLGSDYVGLPTAALFANAGFHVTAVDIKNDVVKAVNSGLTPINEHGLKSSYLATLKLVDSERH